MAVVCPFPPIRIAASQGPGPLPGTFFGLSPVPNTEPGTRHVINAHGVKDQTCYCANETEDQTAVGRNPTPDVTPSQNSPQVPPCSGILQVPGPAPPLALSLVSPAPWSHLVDRPGAKAGNGPWQLAALALGFSGLS